MTANNGWPGDPGVPLNPERDGWHWVRRIENNRPFPLEWTNDWTGSRDYCWAIMGSGEPEDVAKNICYLGPVLLPDEAAALQARADRNAAGFARVDAEAERAKFLHKQEIAALQKRVAKLEALLKRADDIANWTGEDLIYAGRSYGSVVQTYKNERAALTGEKDE